MWREFSDKQFEDYERVLRECARLRLAAVNIVREEFGFTDDNAIHAAAFTISKDALQIVGAPDFAMMPLPGEAPSLEEDADGWVEDIMARLPKRGRKRIDWFIDATARYAGTNHARVYEILQSLEKTPAEVVEYSEKELTDLAAEVKNWSIAK